MAALSARRRASERSAIWQSRSMLSRRLLDGRFAPEVGKADEHGIEGRTSAERLRSPRGEEPRHQRKTALGVGPQRQCKKPDHGRWSAKKSFASRYAKPSRRAKPGSCAPAPT